MRIIRVFPRRTKATPDDEMAVVGREPGLFDEADAVHISVSFTWDLPRAEYLAKQWKYVAPVTVGGPATGERSGNFVQGKYIKRGYTITSRGCNNRCWFCQVWRREGNVRELPIVDGWNILDDNLLSCSDEHVRQVFAMLSRQKKRPVFTGGLEARILKPWYCQELVRLKPTRLYFAYDTPDDLEPLRNAGKMLMEAGFTVASHKLVCYVLCGYPKDTIEKAEKRMRETIDAGFTPFGMLYRDAQGETDPTWRRWVRQWVRPHIIYSKQAKENP